MLPILAHFGLMLPGTLIFAIFSFKLAMERGEALFWIIFVVIVGVCLLYWRYLLNVRARAKAAGKTFRDILNEDDKAYHPRREISTSDEAAKSRKRLAIGLVCSGILLLLGGQVLPHTLDQPKLQWLTGIGALLLIFSLGPIAEEIRARNKKRDQSK